MNEPQRTDSLQFLFEQAQATETNARDTGREEDVQAALEAWFRCVDATAPEDRRDAANELGYHFQEQFLVNGQMRDLELALALYRRAVAPDEPGSAHPGFWMNLGNALKDRYLKLGNPEDLEDAIRAHDRSLHDSPEDPDLRPQQIHNRAACFRERFLLQGDRGDFRKALEGYRESIELLPSDSPHLPSFLSNLATIHDNAFELTGDLEQLRHAVEMHKEAVRIAPADAPRRCYWLNNLGNAQRNLALRTLDLEDRRKLINESVEAFNNALECSPEGDPMLPSRRNNLGNALRDRFEVGQMEERDSPGDLDQAIEEYRRALESLKETGSYVATVWNNLGTALWTRFEHARDREDLDEAVRSFEKSLGKTSELAPPRPGRMTNLAQALLSRSRLGDVAKGSSDRNRAFGLLREAADLGLDTEPTAALVAARTWATEAFRAGEWKMAAQGYERCFEILEHLVQMQLFQSSRESWLREAQRLGAEAALTAVKLGNPRSAVEWLERGIARLYQEALGLHRALLEDLEQKAPEPLVERYRDAAWRCLQLRNLDRARTDVSEHRSALQEARREVDRLLKEIREIRELESFLRPPGYAEIQAAATQHPLLYLAFTVRGGLAVEVEGSTSEPRVVELPELTPDRLQERLRAYAIGYGKRKRNRAAWCAAFDGMAQWLWQAVLGPVTASFGMAPRRTLIPVGLLHLLPWHSAWREDSRAEHGRRYVVDDTTITYAPSARLLQAARRSADLPIESVLVVADPQPSSKPRLSTAQQEALAVEGAFPQAGEFLLGGDARRDRVLGIAHRCSVLHFAVHAKNLGARPLQSPLFLADDQNLTLGDLFDHRLDRTRLVVLAACDSGLAGAHLPDEAVGFPGGLVQAGVPGVVASLWAVESFSTTLLMVSFYEHWQYHGLAPAEALRAAQLWLRNVSVGDLREMRAAAQEGQPSDPLSRFVGASETVGLELELAPSEPGYRPYAHPIHWAAFAFTGA